MKQTPEQGLAEAKFIRMFRDLAGKLDGISDHDKFKWQENARSWFFDPNHDFRLWCDMLGLDPEFVREKARKVMAEGVPRISGARRVVHAKALRLVKV